MKKIKLISSIFLVIAICAMAVVFTVNPTSAAPGTSTSAYCTPPNTISNGITHPIDAIPVQADLVYGTKCPGQLGDIFNDGVLSVSPALTGISGLNYTIPDNVFVVNGTRVHAAAASFTAPASQTVYLYLSDNSDEGTWTQSTSAIAPTNTVLEYTLTTGLSSFTESDPPFASLKILGTLTAADFTASNQSGHAGFMATYDSNGKLSATATPTPAPTSSPIAGSNVSVTGTYPYNIAVTIPTPSPVAGSNVTISGTYPYTIAAITPTPAPTPSPIAGTNITITGTYPYTINSTGGGASGVSQITAGQNITLSPVGGTGNVTVGDTVTPGPQATPSPTAATCESITGSWPYTQGPDLTCSPTWTGNHTFQPSSGTNPAIVIQPSPTASPGTCPGAGLNTPAPQAQICVGPYASGSGTTTAPAIVIGKSAGTGWGGTTAASSAGIQFIWNNGAGDRNATINVANNNVMNIGTGGFVSQVLLKTNSQVAGALQTEALSNGSTTMSYVAPMYTATGATITSTLHASQFTCSFSGTTCTTSAWTGAAVFTAAADLLGCSIIDTSTTAPSVRYTPYNPTTTTISFVASASTTDVITGFCWGY